MSTEICESGLTDKQERFAHEYLIDQNASAAALRAGYSARSHRAQASQLMADPDVRERVRELLEEMYELIKVNALALMQERLNTAFFDPRCLVDAQSRVKPLAQWDDAAAGVMHVSFDVRADGESVMRARQPSRGAALSALERRFANFMRLQEENTITVRERDDLHRAAGRDPAALEAGEAVRLVPEWARRNGAAQAHPPGELAVVDARVRAAPGVEALLEPVLEPILEPLLENAAAPAPRAAPRAGPPPAARPVPEAGAAAPPACAASARYAQPQRIKEDKFWCDLEGNINVDHPHCPPEVRARELEKRQRGAARNRS